MNNRKLNDKLNTHTVLANWNEDEYHIEHAGLAVGGVYDTYDEARAVADELQEVA